jgi:hypothetical protein
MKILPTQILEIMDSLNQAIRNKYSSYKNVTRYIERWIPIEECWDNFQGKIEVPRFRIVEKENGQINLEKTLGLFDDETLLKMAIEMGIKTPDIIYSIPEIKGILAKDYTTASETFEEAYKNVDSNPAQSITMANSALESIIKYICEDNKELNSNATLYELTEHILKQFGMYPDKKASQFKTIGSSFLAISKAIEEIRSKYSNASHGKTEKDIIIKDSLFSKFLINSVTTVGLFLLNYYEKFIKNVNTTVDNEDAVPF